MVRIRMAHLSVWTLALGLSSTTVLAQSHSHPRVSGFHTLPATGHHAHSHHAFHHHYSDHQYQIPFVVSVFVQPTPVVAVPVCAPSFSPRMAPMESFSLSTTTTTIPSPPSPAARLKSLELQAKGDQKMREQKWGEARAAYASAVTATPHRGDAHFRLAVCQAVLQRYDSAIREFKRAADLDPKCVRSARSLKSLFGVDSHAIRTSIIGKVTDWVNEDLQSSDRLFLCGAMLKLNEDPQGTELLRSAFQNNAGADSTHIKVFLEIAADAPHPAPPQPQGLPELKQQPQVIAAAVPTNDLRFPKSPSFLPVPAPVPMPDLVPPQEPDPVKH